MHFSSLSPSIDLDEIRLLLIEQRDAAKLNGDNSRHIRRRCNPACSLRHIRFCTTAARPEQKCWPRRRPKGRSRIGSGSSATSFCPILLKRSFPSRSPMRNHINKSRPRSRDQSGVMRRRCPMALIRHYDDHQPTIAGGGSVGGGGLSGRGIGGTPGIGSGGGSGGGLGA